MKAQLIDGGKCDGCGNREAHKEIELCQSVLWLCDNCAWEIRHRLGHLELLNHVTEVRHG